MNGAFNHELLQGLGVKITRLVSDSRQVLPGDTFVAYPGEKTDGRQFIAQAIAQGANAVIWEAHNFKWRNEWLIPNLSVSALRDQIGYLAAGLQNNPSSKLWMVGVTGTNGKTSCSHWVAQSLSALGRKCALVGTLGNGFPPSLQSTQNTTPDAIRLQGLLAEFLQQGAQAAAMEVSSHALEQGRVNGVEFDVAMLTNLSRDHLDYHGNMESYASAKRKLFAWDVLKYAVINLDDAFGIELAQQLRDKKVEVIGYGLRESALRMAESAGVRMVFGDDLKLNAQGCRMCVHSSWGSGELRSGLLGRFNAENLLGTLAVLLVSGIDLPDALRELGYRTPVAGRMQRVGAVGQPAVVVDYAHTPDALEKVLLTLRELTDADKGRLICVFGCGGDRDRGKRPMMGTVASRVADLSIVTSDNPRSEKPEEIIAAIVQGMTAKYEVVESRSQAIARAISGARAQDTVLIAGKGHEDYQEVHGVKHPFSDVAEAQRCLKNWHAGGIPA